MCKKSVGLQKEYNDNVEDVGDFELEFLQYREIMRNAVNMLQYCTFCCSSFRGEGQ
jgi:hypothetical protein